MVICALIEDIKHLIITVNQIKIKIYSCRVLLMAACEVLRAKVLFYNLKELQTVYVTLIITNRFIGICLKP